MSNFKVLNEQTISLKHNKKILVILSSEEGKFGVEVVEGLKGFGRIKTPSKDAANEIFNLLYKRLIRFKKTETANAFIESVFALTRPVEVLFALRFHNRTMQQSEVGKLVKKFNFQPVVKYNCPSKGHIKIGAKFGNRKVGDFNGIRFGEVKFSMNS